jgi:glycosyltransferase involved in cell wall biosynthesis
MRILFLINFYQIHGSGGQDLSCQQVISGLKERGHPTLVLTSMQGTNNVPVEADGIYRSLYLEMDLVPWRHSITFFTRRKAREKHNLQVFEGVVEQFKPDIIFIWGMWNLPRSLPAFAEARYLDKIVYRFATYEPTLSSQHEMYWRTPGRKWYSRLPKRVVSHIALAMLAKEKQLPPLTFKHAICVSAATRNILVEAGIPIENARVIHTGLDPRQFSKGQKTHQPDHKYQTLNLLYAGRIYPEKGVDTAINALEKLVFGQDLRNIKLSVVGSGSPEYENFLHHLVDQAGLNDYVSFSGHVPAEEMPQLLQKFDVLLVPSIWQEPFSRIVLEGMISSLVVIATPTGGTTEILKDGENGLLFAPGDPEDLAQKIVSLAIDPELRRRLATAGQQTVLEGFTMTKMIDEIEGYLQEVGQVSAQKQTSLPERKEEGSITEELPTVSVIIPTYNRKDMLLDTLNSLAQQTYSNFEVIVVDDGSADGTPEIAGEAFPFIFRYFRQSNQGATAARNLAARKSRADILVFLDDDILLEPDYLTYLVREHATRQNAIVVGTVDIQCEETTPLSQTINAALASSQNSEELMFTDVYSNNMSIRREAYFEIGMYHDLGFVGSSSWCDVDLGYRAYRQGFDFRRSIKARCLHRDYFAGNLDRYKNRARTSALQAVRLFQKYPELLSHLSMFHDKTPMIWGQDSPPLLARKLARSMASSRPALWIMEKIVITLEKSNPTSKLLPPLYRYIVGGYIFHGYRQGLRKFGKVDNKGRRILQV